MTLRKIRDSFFAPRSALAVQNQPPYHTDLSDGYLAALQAEVDAAKPAGFKLTPIGESGW